MKLLLTFVEGEHDVVFVDRSLRVHAGFVDYPKPLREFPSPLGTSRAANFLLKQLEHDHDVGLRDVKRPPLPRLEIALIGPGRDVLALIYQVHGVKQLAPLGRFLRQLYTLLGSASWEVKSCAAAVVVDADDVGVTQREGEVDSALRPVTGHGTSLTHGAWQVGAGGPVGVWVFHDAVTKLGTLEDYLDPIGRANFGALWTAAEGFVDGAVSHAGSSARFPAGRPSAARTKAVLTASGQCARPGAAMHGMLAYGVLDGAHLQTSTASRELARFLASAP